MPVLPSHIETSQLICYANQLTGFYMMATLAFNGLNTGKLANKVSFLFSHTILDSRINHDFIAGMLIK